MQSELNRLNTKQFLWPVLLRYVAGLVICITAAYLLAPIIVLNVAVAHLVMQLIGVFIMFLIFIVTWNIYKYSPLHRLCVGLGFLMAAIFYCYSTFFYSYYKEEIALWFFLIGGFIESFAILLNSINIKKTIAINRWVSTLSTLMISFFVLHILIKFQYSLPMLMDSTHNITNIGIAIEVCIMLSFLLSIIVMKNKMTCPNKDINMHMDFFVGILLALTAEICFMMHINNNVIYHITSQLVKIVYYCFLFKWLFVNTIIYPYEKLNKERKYIRSAFNGFSTGLVSYDLKNKVFILNKAAEDLLGCKEADVQRLSIQEVIVKIFGSEQIGKAVIKKLEEEDVYHHVNEYKNSKGENIKLLINANKIDDEGYLIFLKTAKKEQELGFLRFQTQTILNAMNNCVLVTDSSHKIILCNKAFEDVVELENQEIINTNIFDLRDKLQIEYRKNEYIKLADRRYVYEGSFINGKGIKKELVLNIAPVVNVEGEIIAYIYVSIDVTLLKKEQERLKQQEKLIILGQMASGIVHEIRNPLTSILGFSQIIMLKSQEENIRDYAEYIEKEVKDLNKVVTDFLTFARPRPPLFHEVKTKSIIESLRLLIESYSFAKSIKLKITFRDEETLVKADINQLKQVLLNILKNAIEAVEDVKKPVIHIATYYEHLTNEMCIAITDNGGGMTEEQKVKIGTPFYTTKDKGTGLGLSICYQVIKEHGGRIEIESQPSAGATFKIFLPCSKEKSENYSKNVG